jgi:hypothetical protein
MLNTQESTEFFGNLKKSLSTRRFSGYCGKGSDLDAFSKYLWNIHLCESLCPCFQLLEVAFRNKVHCQIGLAINDSSWILNECGIISEKGLEAIRWAKESLQKDGAIITEDLLVSEMKFGFWTSLLNSKYDRLWPKIIAEVFPNMPKTIRTRGDVSVLMNSVRKLRNAALHHHSIWHWHDLKEQHNNIMELIGFICVASSITADQIDRFPTVHSNGVGECQKIASKILSSVQKPVEDEVFRG